MALAPWLFTNSSAVMAAMAGLTPLLCVTLVVHTASMATEGMLLAGACPASMQARERCSAWKCNSHCVHTRCTASLLRNAISQIC